MNPMNTLGLMAQQQYPYRNNYHINPAESKIVYKNTQNYYNPPMQSPPHNTIQNIPNQNITSHYHSSQQIQPHYFHHPQQNEILRPHSYSPNYAPNVNFNPLNQIFQDRSQ